MKERKNGTSPFDTNKIVRAKIEKLLQESAEEMCYAGTGAPRFLTREQVNGNEQERLQKIWELDAVFAESRLYFKPENNG